MRALSYVTFVLAIFAAIPGTSADGERACETFTVYSPAETFSLHFSDLDGDGRASVGDKRVGQSVLTDVDGNKVGTRYVSNTLREVNADGEVGARSIEMVFALEDGTIFVSYDISAPPRANFDIAGKSMAPRRVHTMTVVGGTGVFAGARGSLDFEPAGSSTSEYLFHLACQ